MKKDISKKDLRDFGLLVGILLPLFIGGFYHQYLDMDLDFGLLLLPSRHLGYSSPKS